MESLCAASYGWCKYSNADALSSRTIHKRYVAHRMDSSTRGFYPCIHAVTAKLDGLVIFSLNSLQVSN
jgi:hypothetical protein